MQVLPVKRVLEQSDDVFVDRVLGGKPFCPCEEISLVECGLFDRERKCQAKRHCTRIDIEIASIL
jgi:hypothetical protein